MTIDEQIEILQAFKEGKKIEWFNGGYWVDKDRDNEQFNFIDLEYRILEPEKTLEEEIESLGESYINKGLAVTLMNDIFLLADKRYQRKDN